VQRREKALSKYLKKKLTSLIGRPELAKFVGERWVE